MHKVAVFLGRFFIGSLFVFSGLSKMFDWQNAEKSFVSALGDWHALSYPFLQNFFSALLPWATAILTIVCAIEVVGGFFVILGVKTRFFGLLLLLVLLPMTLLLHPFWFFEGSREEMQLTLFMKNIGVLGGLFYILAFGSEVLGGSDFEG